MGGGFALYLRATLGRRWLSWSGLAILAAPTTLITLIAGQNGFVLGALLVGGLRCLGRAPVLAGVLFGLLTFKPQFGLLVPVALLAARQGRAIAAACVTALACVAASTLVFGPSIWRVWLDNAPLFQTLLTDNRPSYLHLMPTVAASVEQVGGSPLLGDVIQVVASLVVAFFIWRCYAKDTERGIVPVLIGAVLATPYGFVYDLPMIAAAFVLEWQWRQRRGLRFAAWEVILAVGLLECATIMSSYSVPLVAALLLSALLAAFLRVRA
jgi:hypothetical protein